jgi:hypothetical protein
VGTADGAARDAQRCLGPLIPPKAIVRSAVHYVKFAHLIADYKSLNRTGRALS